MGSLVKITVNSDIRKKFDEVCAYAGNHGAHLGLFIVSKMEKVMDRIRSNKEKTLSEQFKEFADLAADVKSDKNIVIDFDYRIGVWDEMGMFVQENCKTQSAKQVMSGVLIRTIVEIYWDIENEENNSTVLGPHEGLIEKTPEQRDPEQDKKKDKELTEETIMKFCENMSLEQIKGFIDQIFEAGLISYKSLEDQHNGPAKAFQGHIIDETLKNVLNMLKLFKKYKKIEYSIFGEKVKVN